MLQFVMDSNHRRLRKKNWLLFRLLVPFIVVAVVQSLLFSGLFLFSGIFTTLNQNEAGMLVEKLKCRQNYIQSEMNRWAHIEELSDEIQLITASVLDANLGANIDELDKEFAYNGHNQSLGDIILLSQCEELINHLLCVPINGIFVILSPYSYSNAQLQSDSYEPLQSDSHEAMALNSYDFLQIDSHVTMTGDGFEGIYIHSSSQNASTCSQFELMVASSLSREYLISVKRIEASDTKEHFTLSLSSDDGRFFAQPLNAARAELAKPKASEKATDYGYWSRPFLINGKGDRVLTYTVPLIHARQAYGVLGIEISVEYLLSLLPLDQSELGYDSSYFVGIEDAQSGLTEKLFVSGSLYDKAYGDCSQIYKAPHSEYESIYKLKSTSEYNLLAAIGHLRLYEDTSPFAGDSWVVMSIIDEGDLFGFSNHMRAFFIILIIVVLSFGVVMAVITSVTISVPVLRLAKKIKETKMQDRIALDRCNIYEMDQLVDEIIKLSDRLVEIERTEKARIAYERDYDVLTNLLSRRAFMQNLFELEKKPHILRNAAMVMLDLDELKQINDTHGHLVGDKYIKAGAAILTKFTDKNALIGRLGGDEFVVFFYGHETSEQLKMLLRALTDELRKEHKVDAELEFGVSFSAGVAFYPDDARSVEQLLKYADCAMYTVKRTTKNSIIEFKKNMLNIVTKQSRKDNMS